jgi:AraC-like DNA-binding protein
MQRVQTFLQHNLAERFTLSDLANAACMSRFHFARMFRLSFGVSPMEYVMRERVEYAKTLLARREQSVASIAATLGFCDQSHFTRSFRRITGWPPCRFVAHREKAQRRAG